MAHAQRIILLTCPRIEKCVYPSKISIATAANIGTTPVILTHLCRQVSDVFITMAKKKTPKPNNWYVIFMPWNKICLSEVLF